MGVLERILKRFTSDRPVPWTSDPTDAPIPQRPIERIRGDRTSRGDRTYRVKEGDTLESIARQCYGDAALASRILQANQQQLGQPPVLYPGLRLKLP